MSNLTKPLYNGVFHHAKHRSILSLDKVLLQERERNNDIIKNI